MPAKDTRAAVWCRIEYQQIVGEYATPHCTGATVRPEFHARIGFTRAPLHGASPTPVVFESGMGTVYRFFLLPGDALGPSDVVIRPLRSGEGPGDEEIPVTGIDIDAQGRARLQPLIDAHEAENAELVWMLGNQPLGSTPLWNIDLDKIAIRGRASALCVSLESRRLPQDMTYR